MSNVPLLKRAKSGFQVIDTARDLKKKVLQICIKLPKRYTDLILKDTVQDAKDVARYTRKANSIFPHNQHEAQIRIDYWIEAMATIQSLSDDINDVSDIPSVLRYKDFNTGKDKGVTMNELDEIVDMVNSEIELIKGCLISDRKRFEKLPD